MGKLIDGQWITDDKLQTIEANAYKESMVSFDVAPRILEIG